MMLQRQSKNARRSGVSMVEMAFFVVVFFMMLFSVIEYSRFCFMVNLAQNAARDAARYAAVRTGGGTLSGEPATITDDDLEQIVISGSYGSQPKRGVGMLGLHNTIQNFEVDAFANDTPGQAWTSAGFGQNVTVRVRGNYRPILPNLLLWSESVPFDVRASVASEAN